MKKIKKTLDERHAGMVCLEHTPQLGLEMINGEETGADHIRVLAPTGHGVERSGKTRERQANGGSFWFGIV